VLYLIFISFALKDRERVKRWTRLEEGRGGVAFGGHEIDVYHYFISPGSARPNLSLPL
jgi:hypothetical protein